MTVAMVTGFCFFFLRYLCVYTFVFRKTQSHIQRFISYHPLQPQTGGDVLGKMVQLHVKQGDESQFLFSTSVDTSLDTLIHQITAIYNGRLKVERICSGKFQRVLFAHLNFVLALCLVINLH